MKQKETHEMKQKNTFLSEDGDLFSGPWLGYYF